METGIQSILAVRLFIMEDTLGALNLYATASDAFDETDVALASVFAGPRGRGDVGRRSGAETLEKKAANRDLIGRAKGILMAREHVTDDQAFDMLRRASQRLNVKLTTVAEKIATDEASPDGSAPTDGATPTADSA